MLVSRVRAAGRAARGKPAAPPATAPPPPADMIDAQEAPDGRKFRFQRPNFGPTHEREQRWTRKCAPMLRGCASGKVPNCQSSDKIRLQVFSKFSPSVTVCSICVHMHGSCDRGTPAVACVANVHAVASQRYARNARAFSLLCMAETWMPSRFSTSLSLSTLRLLA